MGFILDVGEYDDRFGIELRSESLRIYDSYKEVWGDQGKHIFAYGNGSFEISKERTKELLEFFDDYENRKKCDLFVSNPETDYVDVTIVDYEDCEPDDDAKVQRVKGELKGFRIVCLNC